MIKVNRLVNREAVQENIRTIPRYDSFFVNEAYVRWVEFFSIPHDPVPCNVARLMMAPSGELIVNDDGDLGIAIRKNLINAS